LDDRHVATVPRASTAFATDGREYRRGARPRPLPGPRLRCARRCSSPTKIPVCKSNGRARITPLVETAPQSAGPAQLDRTPASVQRADYATAHSAWVLATPRARSRNRLLIMSTGVPGQGAAPLREGVCSHYPPGRSASSGGRACQGREPPRAHDPEASSPRSMASRAADRLADPAPRERHRRRRRGPRRATHGPRLLGAARK
jgi:hypothetical protein